MVSNWGILGYGEEGDTLKERRLACMKDEGMS